MGSRLPSVVGSGRLGEIPPSLLEGSAPSLRFPPHLTKFPQVVNSFLSLFSLSYHYFLPPFPFPALSCLNDRNTVYSLLLDRGQAVYDSARILEAIVITIQRPYLP